MPVDTDFQMAMAVRKFPNSDYCIHLVGKKSYVAHVYLIRVEV